MVALDSKQAVVAAEELARKSLGMVGRIASRLHRCYGWVDLDDLGSYAYLGLVKAARIYEKGRGVPFERFAFRKAMYVAIDEMRRDGVLKRRRANPGPSFVALSPDIPDPSGSKGLAELERRDLCQTLLGRLRRKERQLLLMHYAEQMTFKQIGDVFDISESAVCLRHKALIKRLRRGVRLASIT
ncbi:MAG: sigma-70 family RNA polymerase sigma factor [Phycisphaerae bacterium]|jgi:RNA polymerase sigma factor (sigma-70 family)|nr:sigma-70 family RNA polymerase sigma factor [Phycisphaerae bacterium]